MHLSQMFRRLVMAREREAHRKIIVSQRMLADNNLKYNVLTYKAFRTGHPAYLRKYLKPYVSSKGTRCSDPELICTWVQQ